MPEVYCKNLNKMVDGGYCSFICNLPETEKRIFYNPFRGIIAECNFTEASPESEAKTTPTVTKKGEPEERFKNSQSITITSKKFLEEE